MEQHPTHLNNIQNAFWVLCNRKKTVNANHDRSIDRKMAVSKTEKKNILITYSYKNILFMIM